MAENSQTIPLLRSDSAKRKQQFLEEEKAKQRQSSLHRHIGALHINIEQPDKRGDDSTDLVSLRDYLFYNDILYYGSTQEKTIQSFRMLDLTNGSPGVVS